jgi:hypothetical protein
MEKVELFRQLFAGRPDVFPVRWENRKDGRTGYSPSCSNEWAKGICGKPKVKCGDCPHQAFIPYSEDIIDKHLRGGDARSIDFVAGVYPLLQDETCWFLAADFDKESWADDTRALLATCRAKGIAAALERSRSGNGGHVWIFFSEPVPAKIARQLGAALITETMENRPEIGFTSYDRFFPNQDTMPIGGFGNLIALPLFMRLIQFRLDRSLVGGSILLLRWNLMFSLPVLPPLSLLRRRGLLLAALLFCPQIGQRKPLHPPDAQACLSPLLLLYLPASPWKVWR